MLMRVCFLFLFIFNNIKWGIFVSCFTGDKRSCTAIFCKNWGLHVRRLGVCGYGYIHGYPWIYPWISTENLWIWIWIWIWMGNFISTASLIFCAQLLRNLSIFNFLFFSPAVLCRIFHFCVNQPCIFPCAAFSCLAFSVAPPPPHRIDPSLKGKERKTLIVKLEGIDPSFRFSPGDFKEKLGEKSEASPQTTPRRGVQSDVAELNPI